MPLLLIAFLLFATPARPEPSASLGLNEQASAEPKVERTRVTADWTIMISTKFKIIENEDSWQAQDENRVVYVSSLSVDDPSDKRPAPSGRDLCAQAGKKLGSKDRLRFSEGDLHGEAEITANDGKFQLMGVVCATGAVATCVIDYDDERHREWAISTWKSLRHRETGAR